MSYDIEVKLASQYINGVRRWLFPAETSQVYKAPYARDGVTIHWWGDGSGADNHDNIVNFFLGREDGSVNYVVSDRKITLMVDPDNVAYTSQGGNPTTISIECQPTLSDEGYKRVAWLIQELEGRYNKKLRLYRHSDWYATQCPGSIDVERIGALVNNEGGSMAERAYNDGDAGNAGNDFGEPQAAFFGPADWNDFYYNWAAPRIRKMGGTLNSNPPVNSGDLKNISDRYGIPIDQLKGKDWNKIYYNVLVPFMDSLKAAAKPADPAPAALTPEQQEAVNFVKALKEVVK
jgi:hypothetical protein